MNLAKAQFGILDRCGIWLSSLCGLHCLLLPVLVPLLPLLASSMFAQAWFERAILAGSIGIGAIAMSVGVFRHHGRWSPLLLLASGAVIYWFKDAFGHDAEPFAVCIGAALIVYGHLQNIKFTRCYRELAQMQQAQSQVTQSKSADSLC